jgi:hypothetical protein
VPEIRWLPEPEPGTSVCLGFDGSDVSDWTCIRGETQAGYSFTPRLADRPTLWNPAEHGGRVPRAEVSAAVADLFARFDVRRMYCDPPGWRTEIEEWSREHGEERVVEWPTYRPLPMFEALERFLTDLSMGRVTHDGCPDTARHLANAKVSHRKDGRYMLTKPDRDRKIDAAVTTVLAHEAAADERAAGWDEVDSTMYVF